MQNAVPDKAKVIDGGPVEIAVRVGDDGVWLGFFAKDGSSVCIDLDKISNTFPEGSISRTALSTWAADRREQAKNIAG